VKHSLLAQTSVRSAGKYWPATLACRVDDEAHQLEVRKRVTEGGYRPTPVIDRFWFKSVYFPEPGGVPSKLATDGPVFGVDED
jgi:glyoxalase family protein